MILDISVPSPDCLSYSNFCRLCIQAFGNNKYSENGLHSNITPAYHEKINRFIS